MKLEEFHANLCKEVDEFLQSYKSNQEKDKENWPDDLPDGDWWEQFFAFLSRNSEGD